MPAGPGPEPDERTMPLPADPSLVCLREITADTVRAVTRLAVAPNQAGFVAPNAVSLAQALFAPEAWYRAVCCGIEAVGFVMLYDESLRSPPPAEPSVGVWRFMIDARHQGRGIGRAALRQVIEHVRAQRRFKALELSYVPGPGCPEPFYLGLGFRHTDRMDGEEVVLELPLQLQLQPQPQPQPQAGGAPPAAQPVFAILGIDHLVLGVRDLDRMLRFYVDALGCSVERRTQTLGLVQLRAGRSLIDLVPLDAVLGRAGDAAPASEGRNLDHFCLRVEPLGAARSRLAVHGVATGPTQTRYGAEGEGPSIYVTDPEGNTVELKGPPDG